MGMRSTGSPSSPAMNSRWTGLLKSRPPNKLVTLANKREPIALSGDAVGAGARPSDVSRHQRQVDDRLGGASGLMALVDAHRPPITHPLAADHEIDQLIEQ